MSDIFGCVHRIGVSLSLWVLTAIFCNAWAAQLPLPLFDFDQATPPVPLYTAITAGSADNVRALLSQGVDPNILVSSVDTKTALMHAVATKSNQQLKIVELLLEAGAKVNAKDKYEQNVLSHALRVGNESVIDLLLANGADINQRATYSVGSETTGDSGLLTDVSYVMRCALDCPVPRFITLLRHGGDALIQNSRNEDALSMAIAAQRTDIVRAMFKKWLIEDKRMDLTRKIKSREHLVIAAQTGASEIIGLLLLFGADPNIRSARRETPLIVLLRQAAFQPKDWQRYLSAIRLLLSHGADPMLQPSAEVPLALAIATQRHEFVQALLEAGSKNITLSGQYIIQALHMAGAEPYELLKITNLLFQYGVPLDTRGEYGEGLLSIAACNTPHVVPALLERGLDINQRNNSGFTPLMYAADMGEKATAIVPLLLQNGADVNAKSQANWTALMLAAGRGAHQIIAVLLAAGADIHAKNDAGQTALVVALRSSNTNIYKPDKERSIMLLLEAGRQK